MNRPTEHQLKIKINMTKCPNINEIETKMEQEQWLQLTMLFLLGYNLKIGIWWRGSFVQTTKNRKLIIFLQYILRVLQLLLCSIVLQNILISYEGPVIFNVTCFLAQPDCRNFLPKLCNTIIKQYLCGKELPSLLSLPQVDVFQEK